jgi:hypothetical protein
MCRLKESSAAPIRTEAQPHRSAVDSDRPFPAGIEAEVESPKELMCMKPYKADNRPIPPVEFHGYVTVGCYTRYPERRFIHCETAHFVQERFF